MSTKKVIIFGSTGAIGKTLIEILAKEEPTWNVVAVSRRTKEESASLFPDYENVSTEQGDVENKDDVLRLTSGVDIIFSCVGFARYERKYWALHWPVVVDNLLQATRQDEKTKLVFCDNLYAFGPTTNISTSSTVIPPSEKSKPAIRSKLRKTIGGFIKEHPNQTVMVVGGADFFGPGATSISFLGDTFTKRILQGKSPYAFGKTDVIHDFCYTVDFARALYLTSIADKPSQYWICPHAIHNKCMNDIAKDVARIAETKECLPSPMPSFLVRILSPFMGFMREMIEMLPFWSQDYSVDDSEFCDAFGVQATPYDEALKATVDFFKNQTS